MLPNGKDECFRGILAAPGAFSPGGELTYIAVRGPVANKGSFKSFQIPKYGSQIPFL